MPGRCFSAARCAAARCALQVGGVLWAVAGGSLAVALGQADGPPAAIPAESSLDDVPLPFEPRTQRSSAEERRLRALAQFAAARTHQQRGELDAALALYARALRSDPQAVPALQATVAVARELGRERVAVRFAARQGELFVRDAGFFRLVALHTTQDQGFAAGLDLYRRALAAIGEERSTFTVYLHLEIGRLSYLAEDYAGACDAFAVVLQALSDRGAFRLNDAFVQSLQKDGGRMYELAAEAAFRAARPAAAEAAVAQLLGAQPDPAQEAYWQARLAAARGDAAAALAALERYHGVHGATAGLAAYDLLAEQLRALGREAEFLPILQAWQQAEPENRGLTYYLARLQWQQGDLPAALALYGALRADDPAAEVYRDLAAIARAGESPRQWLAVAGEVVGKSGGLESLGAQAATGPDDAAWRGQVVACAREELAAGAERLTYGERAAAGWLSLANGELPAAEEFFNLALAVQPGSAPDLLLSWGLALLTQDRYAEAAGVFQRALDEQLVPADDPTLPFYLSGALELTGRTDEALAAADRAIQLGGGSARLQSRRPWILYHARRTDEARAAYEQFVQQYAAQHDSEEVRSIVREARLALSNLYVQQGDYRRGEELIELVLDEFPADATALNDLGYLWAEQNKQLPWALELIQQAVAADPENTFYRDSLGWVLHRLGRNDEALRELTLAAARQPPDPVVQEHLGEVYLALGRLDEAGAAFRLAAERFAENGEAAGQARVLERLAACAPGGAAAAPPAEASPATELPPAVAP